MNGISIMFDQLIQNNSEQEMVFEFEGSEIISVQRFMKSFGAINKPYPVLTKKWI